MKLNRTQRLIIAVGIVVVVVMVIHPPMVYYGYTRRVVDFTRLSIQLVLILCATGWLTRRFKTPCQ